MAAPGPRTYAARQTSTAITPQELLRRPYVVADGSMLEREAGALGSGRGTDYVAGEVERPSRRPAGEVGYFR